jgi:phytoene dehydrogenase-like protein
MAVSVPSLLDATRATGGRHLMEVTLQFVPYQDRDSRAEARTRTQIGKTVVQALEPHFDGLAASIVRQQVWTPADLERSLGLPQGNGSHGEMMLDQILFFRPTPETAHYRTPLRGLYLCGAGAHPGGGVTGRPGRLAARRALQDSSLWRTRR